MASIKCGKASCLYNICCKKLTVKLDCYNTLSQVKIHSKPVQAHYKLMLSNFENLTLQDFCRWPYSLSYGLLKDTLGLGVWAQFLSQCS